MCFYYIGKHFVLPRHLFVVEYYFIPSKAKPEEMLWSFNIVIQLELLEDLNFE